MFDASGNLVRTIVGGPNVPLASPWGIAIAPANFGQFSGDLLVGNFSFIASEINAFDLITGMLVGTIPINVGAGNTPGGLWFIGFGGGTTNHADLVAPITYPNTFNQWFSSSSFAQPAPLTWGDSPRNAIKGPGRDNWNLSLYKTFQFTERAGLEFRAESFNTWNHTQFTGVDTGLFDGSGFGKVNATADPRVFQLGAKVFF